MFVVIRIKGMMEVKKEIKDTLEMLRLKNINNCVVVPETPDYKGMIKKVKDYITWGEIDFDTLLEMLKKRGRLIGEKRLTEETIKDLGFKNLEDMVKTIFEGKIKMKEIPKLKPVFRLTPPSKGFKSTKEPHPKGDLGYRGEKINDLIKKMI
jgi:large subunit ribosomal protein L30